MDLKGLWRWAKDAWVTRSMLVSSAATVLDLTILVLCVELFRVPNPMAAMIGVSFGSMVTFFANRHFAFRDRTPELAPQAVKFILTTAVAMVIHGGIVYLLADRMKVPVVFAKIGADILVFSVGQLLVLRYVVFPKRSVRA